MKKKIFLVSGSCLILLLSFFSCGRDEPRNPVPDDSVRIACAPELNSLAQTWANTYQKMNPEAEVEVRIISPSLLEDLADPSSEDMLWLITEDYNASLFGSAPWNAVVGREVIVTAVNSANPYLEELRERGISPAKYTELLTGENQSSWGSLLDTESKAPVSIHVLDQPLVYSMVAGFSGVEASELEGVRVGTVSELRSALERDPYAMGICRLSDLIDPVSKGLYSQLSLVPIDRNANGHLDYKENIYADAGTFSRGVWIGKYPRELYKNIYSVSATQPVNQAEIAFLKWVLTEGQVLLDNHGYSHLESQERIAKTRLIDSYKVESLLPDAYAMPREAIFFRIIFPGIMGLIAIILVIRILLVVINRNNLRFFPDEGMVPDQVLHEETVKSPGGLYYDRTHTWAFMEKDGMVRIGIDDFLQHITGPLTRVKMKNPGEMIRKGKPVLSIIQEGKQLDICAPVSGMIREHNNLLISDISLINSSPYTDGWVYKIEPTNWLTEIQFLLLGKHYKEWLKNEFLRLKEFFANPLRQKTPAYIHVLQDGGELKDSILSEYGPETWEEFQTDFLHMAS